MLSRVQLGKFITLLSPYAPYITEELWRGVLGQGKSTHLSNWPQFELDKLMAATQTIVLSVNGKPRSTLEISNEELRVLSDKQVIRKAKTDQRIAKFLEGQQIKREIYVPGKIVNFVF